MVQWRSEVSTGESKAGKQAHGWMPYDTETENEQLDATYEVNVNAMSSTGASAVASADVPSRVTL